MKKNCLFIIVVLSYFSSILRAQDASQRSVTEILNPDGTIQKGAEGSFNVQGYEMRFGRNGEPIFLPKLQSVTEGTWSSLGTGTTNGVNGTVRAIAVTGDNVFVGGIFTQAGEGQLVNHVARYNLTTNTWHPLGTGANNGVNNDVYALAVLGENVFVGGFFTQAGGQSANYVARYNFTTDTWHTLGTDASNGVNNNVLALAVSGENVFVGGWFTRAGGQSAFRVAYYNLATNTWHSLGSGSSNGVTGYFVQALAVAEDNLFVGGNIWQAGGQPTNYVARYNLTSNSWHSLGTDASNGVRGSSSPYVYALAVSGENVFVGGAFTQAGEQSANYVARFNLTTNTWHSLGADVNNGVSGSSTPWVNSLSVLGDTVFIGGNFLQAGGQYVFYVAYYNLTTNTWHTLSAGANIGVSGISSPYVYTVAVSGKNVFVGGNFTQAGGVAANRVARYTETLTSLEENNSTPDSYSLYQNYPNPFNPSTTISFTIPNSEFVTLKVYDVLGNEIVTLVNNNLDAGNHSYSFEASNLTSGVYFYKLQTRKFSQVKKMILMK